MSVMQQSLVPPLDQTWDSSNSCLNLDWCECMMAKLDLDWCECVMAKLDCVNGHKIRLVWMYVSQLRLVCICDSQGRVVSIYDSQLRLVCICDSQVRLVWIYDSQLRLVWVCDSQVRLVCVNDSQLILVWMHYIHLRFVWAHDSQVRLVLCEWTASLDWFEPTQSGLSSCAYFQMTDYMHWNAALLPSAACIHPGTVCCMLWPLWSWASVKLGSWASVKLGMRSTCWCCPRSKIKEPTVGSQASSVAVTLHSVLYSYVQSC